MPEQERMPGFYRLWSRKEALIKALGKGLSQSLSSFSVSVSKEPEKLFFESKQWSITSLKVHPDYQAAVASNQEIKDIETLTYC